MVWKYIVLLLRFRWKMSLWWILSGTGGKIGKGHTYTGERGRKGEKYNKIREYTHWAMVENKAHCLERIPTMAHCVCVCAQCAH